MESIKNGITFLINSLGRTRFQRYLRSLIRPETAPREKKASKNPVKKLLYSFFFFFLNLQSRTILTGQASSAV